MSENTATTEVETSKAVARHVRVTPMKARRMIDQRQAESLEILRGWLDRGEETA